MFYWWRWNCSSRCPQEDQSAGSPGTISDLLDQFGQSRVQAAHSFHIKSSKGNRRLTTGTFRHRARPVRAPGDRGPTHCVRSTDRLRPRPHPSSSPRGGQDRSITRPAHTLSNLRSEGGGLDRQTSEYGGGFRASVGSSDRYKQIEKKGRKGLEEVRAILSRRLDQFWNMLPFTAREKKQLQSVAQ
jgi:hypothetical protein